MLLQKWVKRLKRKKEEEIFYEYSELVEEHNE